MWLELSLGTEQCLVWAGGLAGRRALLLIQLPVKEPGYRQVECSLRCPWYLHQLSASPKSQD